MTSCKPIAPILYVKVGEQNKGVGFFIWSEVEKAFPDTKIWRTCTPCFDRRNVGFYVNKCRFYIISVFDIRPPDPHAREEHQCDAGEGMFLFEKTMR